MKILTKFILLMTVFVAITTLTAVNIFAAENLALNKTVEASGWFEGAQQDESPQMAVDGDVDTKWCARTEELLEGEEYHWIIVDLGEEKEIGKYVLQNASLCQIDYGKYHYNLVDFTVEVSTDKQNWTKIDEQTDLDGEEYETYEKAFSEPIKARYFKLNAITPNSEGNATVRLPEIEIYAYDANTAPSPTPTTTPSPTASPTPPKTSSSTTATPTKATETPVISESSNTDLGLFIGIGAAVIVIGGVAAFIIVKNKKKEN